jgi:phospholipid/cholesterol/gamma-HCH transport system substrate-binding protein
MVELAVSRNSAPHADASIRISALDFFGAQKVDYFPGTSPNMLADGQVIAGQREVQIMSTAASLADQAAEVLTGLQALLSEETTASLRETMDAAQDALRMVARLDNGPLMRSATESMAAMAQIAGRVDSIASNPALDRSVERLDAITEGLEEMTDGLGGISDLLSSILVKIDSGQGSIGQLVNDTTAVQDMHAVMNSLQLLLDDIRERPQRYVNVRASIF